MQTTLGQKCDYLECQIPDRVLEDGSYISWIAPDGKSKKKGGTKIMVRVI
ncbi:hypothetical protein [Nostoc sp.]